MTSSDRTTSSPMLLPPAMVEDPSPLRVSTFAKPEYAKLTFTYGRTKTGTVTWPVHCQWFKVRIPTGRQASALTGEPSLIRYELTVPPGKRSWNVVRDITDPNETVFTCSPPPGDPAAFDGTWSVQLELWGIEVNGGIGPADISWEERTSTTGASGAYEERSGQGRVNKLDDSFVLHSFRPASVAISRNTKATLHWEGTANARYTMYYRKPDGTQGSATVSNGTWTSPENLVDDTSFTLKAEMGNETRYLTTYVKVNNPDIVTTAITARGDLRFEGKAGLSIPADGGSITVYGALTATAGKEAGGGVLTANGPLTANVWIKTDKLASKTNNGTISIDNHVKMADDKVLRVDDLRARTDTATLTIKSPVDLNKRLTALNEIYVDGSGTGYKGLHVQRIYAPDGAGINFKSPVTMENNLLRTSKIAAQTDGATVTISDHTTLAATKVLRVDDLRARTDATTLAVKSPVVMEKNLKLAGTSELVGKVDSYVLDVGKYRTFTATTSGLVVAHVDATSSNACAIVKISSMSYEVRANGNHSSGRPGRGCASFAIRKGESFTITHSNDGGNSKNSIVNYYWIPFGYANLPQRAAAGVEFNDEETATLELIEEGTLAPDIPAAPATE
ncbi:hypothetical protein [Kitasatospora sp. NPDC094011]|uniref:hypothetical protein n=1 Tax=Kitasatospora sp. NPDC094011 TaxID=3364090 RepID=UPI00381F739A